MQHDTELDPKVCYTDTHGYTEVVMATAVLLGYELAPRIKDIKDQTLYKVDRQQCSPSLVLHRLGCYARQNSVYQAFRKSAGCKRPFTF